MILNRLISLAQVCDFQGGNQPPKSEFMDSPQDGNIRLLQIRDFSSDDKAVYVQDTPNLRKVEADEILLGRYGGSVGKVLTGKKGAYNVAMMKVVPDENQVINRFVFYVLSSNQFQLFIKKIGESRVAQDGFNKKDLSRFYFPLPSIEDQHKIVGRLNKIQELIDKRKETIHLLKEFLNSIFLEMFGDPYQNPFSWNQKELKSLCTRITDGTHRTPNYTSSGIPFITATHVDNNHIDWTNSKFISQDEYEQLLSRGTPKLGDILLTKSGTLGRVAVIKENLKFSFYESVALIQPKSELIDSDFLAYLLQTEAMKFVLKGAEKGVAVKHLHLNMLRELKIIIPPLVNQIRFSEKVKKIESINTLLNDSLDNLKILFQIFLQNAFNDKSQINEEEIFESLLQNFTKEDLKQGNRLKYLINWLNCEEPKFSKFESYDLAWERLRELLEDGSIVQTLNKNELKLKVAE